MKLQYCVKFAMAAFFTMALSPALMSPVFSATAGNEALIEAARREGELVYYASMNLAEANAIIGEFEKRYPFIKVKLNRTGSEKLLAKVMTEYRTKKLPADVIQTVEFSMHLFNRAGVLSQYIPQANLQYPNEFKEAGFWTTVYYNPYVVAYNSKLVPRQTAPKRYEDLLDPKWKGKMMMDGTKADWFAGILQIMGQERGLKYMRDLAKQQPSPREGHELLAQLVAAGEGLMDINIPIASVERMKERGAPIDWANVGTAPAIMVGIGISSQAAHPNAAKLYIDFALSREGQRLIRTPGRLGARMDLAREQADLVKAVKIVPVNPALAEKLGEYAKQLRSIFGG
jgi:iron(III) transport system substrate-binding protein